ncbi:hypothetical protein GWK47_050980 [Chionoecetes opilio]|uniref:Uncharacterized protein n=1 Tax=Chionoecetes opilio TaxID=41210 RepID=A0A8J4Y2J5_CHIOP|nr:hypothetical protein GWK47_050980 [Chionoecetes opilio]
MCTPSRAALLTARYPARYGITISITGMGCNFRGKELRSCRNPLKGRKRELRGPKVASQNLHLHPSKLTPTSTRSATKTFLIATIIRSWPPVTPNRQPSHTSSISRVMECVDIAIPLIVWDCLTIKDSLSLCSLKGWWGADLDKFYISNPKNERKRMLTRYHITRGTWQHLARTLPKYAALHWMEDLRDVLGMILGHVKTLAGCPGPLHIPKASYWEYQ